MLLIALPHSLQRLPFAFNNIVGPFWRIFVCPGSFGVSGLVTKHLPYQ